MFFNHNNSINELQIRKMGIHCYNFDDKRDHLKEKMIKLKKNFQKQNLIGIGASSKVNIIK